MDFVKANWSARKPGGIRPAHWLFWLWMEQMLLLADGDLRKLDNPKRKRSSTLHLRPPFLRTSF